MSERPSGISFSLEMVTGRGNGSYQGISTRQVMVESCPAIASSWKGWEGEKLVWWPERDVGKPHNGLAEHIGSNSLVDQLRAGTDVVVSEAVEEGARHFPSSLALLLSDNRKGYVCP